MFVVVAAVALVTLPTDRDRGRVVSLVTDMIQGVIQDGRLRTQSLSKY